MREALMMRVDLGGCGSYCGAQRLLAPPWSEPKVSLGQEG